MKRILSISLSFILLLSFSIPAKAADISPIPISTWEDLYNIGTNLSGDYELMNDLDKDSFGYDDYASETANGGEGWIPLGEYVPDVEWGAWIPIDALSTPFTGTFEGNGHTISGLTINRPLLYGVGLFGYIRAGSVSNLTLADVDIAGVRHTGPIVGYTWGAAIDNVEASGNVTSKNNAGGLVGTIRFDSSITNCSTSAVVRGTGTGSLRAGGLAGALYESVISNSHATGNVYGTGYDTGGLVGSCYNEARIENSYATGDVTGTKGAVGGLVGSANQATLFVDCHATGNVSGVTMELGGLVGDIGNGTTVRNSYATGNVTTLNGKWVGGLIGISYASFIESSYATGNVSSGSNQMIGGLVGYLSNVSAVRDSYATGNAVGYARVGGLAGWVAEGSSVDRSYSKGFVLGTVDSGGLVGLVTEGTVASSYWDMLTSDMDTSAGGTGRQTSEMLVSGTYPGWDFGGVWQIEEAASYPYFQWQADNIPYPSLNLAPVAVDDTATVDEDTVENIIDVLDNDSDADGGTITITGVTQPANGTVAIADEKITYTPDPDYIGTDTFIYTISDGQGSVNGARVTVTIVNVNNDMPVVVDDSYITTEDEVLIVEAPGVFINDTDADGDSLNALVVGETSDGTLDLQSDGSFTYAPDSGFYGSDSFTYTAFDGFVETTPAVVTISVVQANDAPVAEDDVSTVTEDSADNVIDVLDNDSDADGGTITVTGVTDPANGSVVFTDDDISYTPDDDFFGTDTFTYGISDGQGASDTALVTVTVTNVNDAPTASNNNYNKDEDEMLVVPAPGVLVNDNDIDGDSLTVLAVDEPLNGVLVLSPDGSFTYMPDPEFSGIDSFSYKANDGALDSNTALVTITVGDVNDVPVASNDTATVDEDSLNNAIDVLSNDTDAEDDLLSVSGVTQPTHGTVDFTSDSVSFTPNADFSGTDNFTYTVSDPLGGTAEATVFVTVSKINDAPVASDDSYSMDEDGALVITAPAVLDNDDDADGDSLTATLVGGPSHGILTLNANGSFVYTPAPEFSGDDSFTYKASDGSIDSNTADVTITVDEVNDAPIAGNDAATVKQDTANTAIAVLFNDSDIDGGTLSITGVVQPANGSVVFSSDSITYSPNSGYYGTDSFTYTVSDGQGGTAVATVAITVSKKTVVNNNTSSNTSSDDTTEIDEDPIPEGVTVQGLGTEELETIDGRSVFTFTVGESSILREIELIMESMASGDSPAGGKTIEIPITNSSADEAIVILNGDTIKALEENGFDLSITREGIQYIVPAAEFMVDKVAKEMGIDADDLASIEFEVKMGEPSAETLALYEKIAASLDIDFIIPPISFEITAVATMANGTTREMKIDTFSTYAERIFEVPAGVDPSQITTGIVFNTDGTYNHVPTEVYLEDGVWYVKVSSLTNSDYAIIWNPITVASVKAHWSQAAVEDMVSRLVIRDPETFAPDAAITRGDFAEYIAKAIGVYKTGIAVADFSDVPADDMQANAIAAAADYGIIKGYPDGTFRPDGLINRQEAMVMFARASRIVSLESQDMARVNTFADAGEIAGWALVDVTTAVGSGIFNGRSKDMLEVTGTFTYAEAATAVRNMLIEAGLIND